MKNQISSANDLRKAKLEKKKAKLEEEYSEKKVKLEKANSLLQDVFEID